MSLLTDVSILGECLGQVCLWWMSPKVQQSLCDHTDCKYKCGRYERLAEFAKWMEPMVIWTPPTHLVHPVKEKLYYPAEKWLSRETVNAMRAAEANLDKFWSSLQTFCEE
jgi:hypothetical protein